MAASEADSREAKVRYCGICEKAGCSCICITCMSTFTDDCVEGSPLGLCHVAEESRVNGRSAA